MIAGEPTALSASATASRRRFTLLLTALLSLSTHAQMPVIISQESGRSATVERPAGMYLSSAYMEAWKVLGGLGLAFSVMSLLDLGLGWYPVMFGVPEWEFGMISVTFSGLAIPTVGLYLMLGSAIALERTNATRAVAIFMIVLAIALAGLCIVFLTDVPLALKAATRSAAVSQSMKKAILKSLILFAGNEVLYVYGAMKGLRRRSAA
jgi:hypothetical protein